MRHASAPGATARPRHRPIIPRTVHCYVVRPARGPAVRSGLALAFLTLLLLPCLSLMPGGEQAVGVLVGAVEAQEPYRQVVPRGARTDRGLFDIHRVDEELLFEIPDSILGREMVLMSRIAGAQAEVARGGDRLGPNQVVRWERRGNRVLLRSVSTEATADPERNIALAVRNSNFEPILHAFPVRAEGERSVVIEVTELYTTDSPTFGLDGTRREEHEVRGLDEDRSYLEWVRSFPMNLEARAVLTYEAGEPPSHSRGGTISLEVHHSMILLPEEPMRPRYYDERVGYISNAQRDYGTDYQGVKERRYLRRYRLEPSDPEAFARGELVEPVNPWVWYLDPATPAEWVPYIKAGIEEWNEAFEEAGFRNAVEVRVAPTEEEDPEFSLLDARYSVVRYVASTVRSANAGGDVIDPRSGEVIRAHMNFYHGLMERLRWWMLSQVAAANPRLQTVHLSPEDMGEALRYVASHEKAHAVGLPHNQRANFVYPPDSIRNPDFVERWGHSASSVGRTRYNYVAQPGDGVPVERRLGIWDKFAVMWGYRPIPEASSPEEEAETLNRWIVERADRPWFRFGDAQFGVPVEWDPYRQTEGISDDPIRAAEYGMLNLQRAAANLLEWVATEGEDYSEVEPYYLQLLTQWDRYLTHAASHVGGLYTHVKRYGEEGPIYTPVPAEEQRRAMRFLDEHGLQPPAWALDLDLLRRLEHNGAVERTRAYQVGVVERLLNRHRLDRLIEQHAFGGEDVYAPAEMLDDLRAMVWRELAEGRPIDTWRRNLQRGYLERMEHLLTEAEAESFPRPESGNLRVFSDDDPPLTAELHVNQSDMRPLARDQLRLLRDEVERALQRGPDRMTRIHLEDARRWIDRLLD